MSKVYIKKNSIFSEVNTFYKKIGNEWTVIQENDFLEYLALIVPIFGGDIASENKFEIAAPYNIESETCQCLALFNDAAVSNGVVWSIVSGGTYAQISNTGLVSISNTADLSSITILATYNGFTASHDMIVTYKSGSNTETSTETIVDESGQSITTITTITENEDGSSYSESTSTILDESGNTIGTIESTTNVNTDGSYESTSTNYDENGDATSTTNASGDTDGNVSTQNIEYDESGNSVVVGYTIDTSNNPDGEKELNGDGINTEYYAFDVTRGFVLEYHFTIDMSNKPSGQNENHHNALTMKRATPSPWYGFQLRQSNTNKYIQLGTQFETGSNTNTRIDPFSTTGNTGEFNIRITYDPTSTGNTFVCTDIANNRTVFTSNKLFPDIEELRYLKVALGYAMDENGDPYRYANLNVINFSINKLPKVIEVSQPVINYDGEEISISCATEGASIYYKLNQTGTYLIYETPIGISATTVVEAYAELAGQTSNVVSATCEYTPAIEAPTIYCDGEYVTISCETPGADIYYRLNQTGTYSLYDSAIAISATTVVEAYAEANGDESVTVTETCVYDGGVRMPVISCDGEFITITCPDAGATIYYRLNQTGNYEIYTAPIPIYEDTFIEAYSTLGAKTSPVVSENCIYSVTHDYSLDYLTFNVLTGGTIRWNLYGTGSTKTIEYSVNNGTWTSLTSGPTAIITVSDGDVVRFKGTNASYAIDKSNYAGFDSGGTAMFDIEGNIMSLVYGDNFVGNTALTGTYNFCSIFKQSNCVSAENLILPSTTLRNYSYRAMFSKCTNLVTPPELPATTLAQGCYWYLFEECAITKAPDLNAQTLVRECYGHMFTGCTSLNYIKCLATDGFSTYQCTQNWVKGVASSGTFVKDINTTWSTGVNGIPTSWVSINDGEILLADPVVHCDGEEITITCETPGADIYYNLNQNRGFTLYTEPIPITGDTGVEAYSSKGGKQSETISQTCVYSPETVFGASNKILSSWTYDAQTVQTPYSVNAIDGHSSSYAKGTFNFETTVSLKKTQPTYLWFQHADQSATIYVDDTLVEKHMGGYNAFFVDISNYAHKGLNNIKVALKNNEGNSLAPAAGDFNFNATLGNVKLFTSDYIPDMSYGYDGFHINSDVANSSATIYVRTNVPTGATVTCEIDDGTYHYGSSGNSTGNEIVFSATVQNPHLWNGTIDPHLYTITLEIYHDGELYHRYQRPYGLRYYRYVINDTTILANNDPYTGFLLNGQPYLLRGVCMHDDLDEKANALNDNDYTQEFSIIQELGCNFIRLAHYPHPKEVYDWCDRLGIVVQTEVPCVNKLQSTMPEAYYTNLETQYTEMVNQHYNHPCIMFWGLSNETTTDDKDFAKTKIEGYTSLIKALDSERLVGYVMSHSYDNPSTYYNNPNVDWFGCNLYVGWYIDKTTNNPTNRINTRVNNIITNNQKALALSEYGCGGTQHCHSDDPQSTTTTGNNARHDIEYQMWLHEGHIASIRNFPQLLFTSQWQLFDIAVSNRNEGYTLCLDGETTSIDDNLRRLNNKGLVERDHTTKKDTFYLYKAEWSSENFVHICGKDYTKKTGRVIKCYTNDGSTLSMYVNNAFVETVNVTDHIALFTARNFSSGDVIRVESNNNNFDEFTF